MNSHFTVTLFSCCREWKKSYFKNVLLGTLVFFLAGVTNLAYAESSLESSSSARNNTCDLKLTCEANVNGSWKNLGNCKVEVQQGDKLFLSVNPNGLSAYHWTKLDGSKWTGENFHISNNIQSSHAGVYRVDVLDANGCKAWINIEVIVRKTEVIVPPCSPLVTFKNTGCKTLSLTSSEGYVGNMEAGKTWSINSKKGTVWTFKVGATVIKSWIVTSCDVFTTNIDSKGCQTAVCNLKLTCEANVNGSWKNLGNCKVEVQQGDKLFLSVNPNGLSAYHWTKLDGSKWTGDNFHISNNIQSSHAGVYRVDVLDANGCKAWINIEVIVRKTEVIVPPCSPLVTFKNTGCKTLSLTSSEGYVGNMEAGKTWSINSKKGTVWTFKVGATVIKSWIVTSCDVFTTNIDSKGCQTAVCNLKLTCEANVNGSWKNLGNCKVEVQQGDKLFLSVNPNGLSAYHWTKLDGSKWTGDNFHISNNIQSSHAGVYRVDVLDANGCKAWINIEVIVRKTEVIVPPCSPLVTFKNTGCKTLSLTSSEGYVGNMEAGKTWSINSKKGTVWTFKVGATVIKSWIVTSCDAFTTNIDSKGCQTAVCNLKLTCEANVNGSWKNLGNCKVEVQQGDKLFLSVNPNGLSAYHWTKLDGSKWTGDNFRVSNKIKSSHAGVYRVDAVDANGCKASVNIEVIVRNNVDPCGKIEITGIQNKIKVIGLQGIIAQVKVFKNNKEVQGVHCNGNCGNSKNITVAKGQYWVQVQVFNKSWQQLCVVNKDINIAGNYLTSDGNSSRIATENEGQLATKDFSLSFDASTANTTATTDILKVNEISTTEATLNVYPNPAKTALFISTTNIKGQLNIYNQFGQMMKQIALGTASEETLQVDLTDYAPGLYLISTQLENGAILSQKVLVTN